VANNNDNLGNQELRVLPEMNPRQLLGEGVINVGVLEEGSSGNMLRIKAVTNLGIEQMSGDNIAVEEEKLDTNGQASSKNPNLQGTNTITEVLG
jgi:hypothetical protein